MEVKNCRICGRLFNYIGGRTYYCPACNEEIEKKFAVVKKYIQENPRATMKQISEDTEVTVQQLEKWVREERLAFTDDSPIGIDCEGCGVSIKSGRFCAGCKDQMQRNLGAIYREEPKQTERKSYRDPSSRMRFLNK